jgi:predicted metal-binding membrane protein
MSTLRPSISPATLARSTTGLLFASAAVVTVAAWLWLAGAGASHGIHSVFLNPQRHQLDGRSVLYAVIMWQAMTVAMMTPVFLRWLLTFATLTADSDGSTAVLRPAAALASGYFVIWLAYSVGAAAIQITLQQMHLLRDGRLGLSSAGTLLILAGLFQFAPVKRACLRHCRNPLTYFLARWHNRPSGGFRLGMTHGAYCIGCCWLLMITGLAMGVMNLAWMAVLTLLVVVEQVGPHGDRIAGALGVAIAGWGLLLLL